MSGSGLGSLVLEGDELHVSLKPRQIDDSVRHMPHWQIEPERDR